MCGHAGVAGYITEHERNAFHDLLYIAGLRGEDGAGVAAIERTHPHQGTVVKTSGGPSILFDRMHYTSVLSQKANFCLIGHTRSKTRGDASWYNAHPFDTENVIGAHNGSIGDYSLNKIRKAIQVDDIDTDSEHFIHYLSEFGIDKSMEMLESPHFDKYAFVWYDKREMTINFLRNKERPFFYVFTKDRTAMFWASEIAFLFAALNRRGIPFNGKDVHELPINTHLSWVIPQKAAGVFGKVVRVAREPRGFFQHPKRPNPAEESARVFQRGASNGSTSTDVGPKYPGAHNVVVLTPNDSTSANSCSTDRHPQCHSEGDLFKVASLGLSYLTKPVAKGDQAHYLDSIGMECIYEEEFDMLMVNGCENCQAQPAWGEPVRFLKDKRFVCAPCMLENRDGVAAVVQSL